MAIISSIGRILAGLTWVGVFGSYFIWYAVIGFVSIIISFYISIYVIDILAPSFGSEKNLNKSAQLVAYSNTPTWIAGLLSFIPAIGFLLVIAGWIYSIYLFYIGLGH
ncbi:MAG TPA: YIP1 family protein [Hanamia sp.]|nr:YIP1 family protein [Hanamia sp.]